MRSILWPYEEVKLSFKRNRIELDSPWGTAEAEADLSPITLRTAERIFREGISSAADLHLIDRLLSNFKHLPFFYFLPRPNLSFDSELCSRDLELNSFWDTEEILELSNSVDGIFDPISILSSLRRQHLADAIAFEKPTAMSKLLDVQSEKTLEAVIFAIRQNHYVTSRCAEVLAPALHLHSRAALIIEDFMEAEKGHDKLMEASLRMLGKQPSEIKVSPKLEKVMNHFAYTAKNNLIAFAFMIDMFERTNPQRKSSVADALIKLGHEKAAKPLLKHLDINNDDHHDLVAFELLQSIGGVDEPYAKEAVSLSATASNLILDQVAERFETMNRLIFANPTNQVRHLV